MGGKGLSRKNSQTYTAVIGDMLASRTLPANARRRTQVRFTEFIESLNRNPRYRPVLVSKFAITLGDEFHGVLNDASVLPDLLWDVDQADGLPKFRMGAGHGEIDTEIPEFAINLDGPALHCARAAIETAKKEKLLGGVFVGFGEEIDRIANGIARLLWFHLHNRTDAQRTVLDLLRQGYSQMEIAKRLHRTPQAVSVHKTAAGWEAYRAGEQALCDILKLGSTQARK